MRVLLPTIKFHTIFKKGKSVSRVKCENIDDFQKNTCEYKAKNNRKNIDLFYESVFGENEQKISDFSCSFIRNGAKNPVSISHCFDSNKWIPWTDLNCARR